MRGSLRRWALRYPAPAQVALVGHSPTAPTRLRHNVTVAIPHFEAPEWCAATVRSFLDQRDVDLTIVVVDNSPSIGLSLPAEVEVVEANDNLGYSGAINHVLARWLSNDPAQGHYFVAACHDCELEPHALATLSSALDADPTLGIVGPSRSSTGPADRISGRVWVSGTCLMLAPGCAAELIALDERLGTYDEDLDLCLRAWDAGWRVGAVPSGIIVTRGSVAQDRTERIACNHVLLAAKRRGLLAAFVETGLQLWRALMSRIGTLRNGGSEPMRSDQARQRLRGSMRGLLGVISARQFHRGKSFPPGCRPVQRPSEPRSF